MQKRVRNSENRYEKSSKFVSKTNKTLNRHQVHFCYAKLAKVIEFQNPLAFCLQDLWLKNELEKSDGRKSVNYTRFSGLDSFPIYFSTKAARDKRSTDFRTLSPQPPYHNKKRPGVYSNFRSICIQSSTKFRNDFPSSNPFLKALEPTKDLGMGPSHCPVPELRLEYSQASVGGLRAKLGRFKVVQSPKMLKQL